MIDLGTVRPGSTLRIPFNSFDKDDGSSITMTDYAVGDILVYKDGADTERGSDAGETATTDFDGKTGKHLAIIDLADDTTADFYKAGSEYLVAINAVTVDTVTTGGWIARFRIGYPGAILDTSIATLASQTSFTLTNGPAENDALNGMVLIVHDKASAVQWTRVVVEDYVGATKTVTLRAAPAASFTIAAGDNVSAVGFDKVDATHVGGAAVAASPLDANDRPLVGIDAASFDPDTDGYAAVVKRTVDAGAGTPADRYSVIFKKNGLENTDAVTVPKIRVFQNNVAATELIAETALTEAGTEESYFYDAVGAELATPGVAYTVVITATIGGSSRTWKIAVGQDTAA